MKVWMVRAGRQGEREAFALENGVAVVGWDEMPDLAKVQTREEIAKILRRTYPHFSESPPSRASTVYVLPFDSARRCHRSAFEEPTPDRPGKSDGRLFVR